MTSWLIWLIANPCVQVLVALLALLVVYAYVRFAQVCHQFAEMGIPSPRPNLLFGNLLQYWREGEIAFINGCFEEFGPMFGYHLGSRPYFFVADAWTLRAIMVDKSNHFAEKEPSLIGLPPDPILLSFGRRQWNSICLTMQFRFPSGKMDIFYPVVEKKVLSLIEILALPANTSEEIDISQFFRTLVMETLLAVLGINTDNQHTLTGNKLSNAVTSYFDHLSQTKHSKTSCVLSHLRRSSKHAVVFESLCAMIIKMMKVNHPGKGKSKDLNLLDMLVDQSRDTCISNSEKEVEATACYVTAFLLSSYKAITNTLCQASLLLARNSKVQNQILKSISDRQQQGRFSHELIHEVECISLLLWECFRLYPHIHRVNLVCTRSCRVNGIPVPEGMNIHVPVDMLHQMPEYWDRPQAFSLERFEASKRRIPGYCYMPFGHQFHLHFHTLAFTMMVAKVTLFRLLQQYKIRSDTTKKPETTGHIWTCVHLRLKRR